jgi:hypothetical protein
MLMSAVSSSPTWRTVLVTVAAAGACGLGAAAEDTAVRPFHIDVPEEALVDLRRRIAATRWPDRENEVVAIFGQQDGRVILTEFGLRRGSGESAELPPEVKEVLTLLINSKTRGRAVLHTMFDGQRERVHPPAETHFQGVRE